MLAEKEISLKKIKINEIYPPIFSTSMDIRISEINYGNHLGNDKMVSLIHEARVRFLESHGFSELNIMGCGLILSDLEVNFKKQVYYKDTITFHLFLGKTTPARTELIYFGFNQNNIEVVRAKTTLAFINYKTNKLLKTPDFFLNFQN